MVLSRQESSAGAPLMKLYLHGASSELHRLCMDSRPASAFLIPQVGKETLAEWHAERLCCMTMPHRSIPVALNATKKKLHQSPSSCKLPDATRLLDCESRHDCDPSSNNSLLWRPYEYTPQSHHWLPDAVCCGVRRQGLELWGLHPQRKERHAWQRLSPSEAALQPAWHSLAVGCSPDGDLAGPPVRTLHRGCHWLLALDAGSTRRWCASAWSELQPSHQFQQTAPFSDQYVELHEQLCWRFLTRRRTSSHPPALESIAQPT